MDVGGRVVDVGGLVADGGGRGVRGWPSCGGCSLGWPRRKGRCSEGARWYSSGVACVISSSFRATAALRSVSSSKQAGACSGRPALWPHGKNSRPERSC